MVNISQGNKIRKIPVQVCAKLIVHAVNSKCYVAMNILLKLRHEDALVAAAAEMAMGTCPELVDILN